MVKKEPLLDKAGREVKKITTEDINNWNGWSEEDKELLKKLNQIEEEEKEKEEEITLEDGLSGIATQFDYLNINNKKQEEQQIIDSIREEGEKDKGGDNEGGDNSFSKGGGEVKEEENGDDDDGDDGGDGDGDGDEKVEGVGEEGGKKKIRRFKFLNNKIWIDKMEKYETQIPGERETERQRERERQIMFDSFLKLKKLLKEDEFDEFKNARKKFNYKEEDEEILFKSENTEHREEKIQIGRKVWKWYNSKKYRKETSIDKGTNIGNSERKKIPHLQFEDNKWIKLCLKDALSAEPVVRVRKNNLPISKDSPGKEQPFPMTDKIKPIQGVIYASLFSYSKIRRVVGFEHEIGRKKFGYSEDEEPFLFEGDIYEKEDEEDEDPKYHERKMIVGTQIYQWLHSNNEHKTPYKIKEIL